MAKTVFDTADLVRLIYSFGDPNHRDLTQRITQEIRPDVHEMTYDRMYWIANMDEEDLHSYGISDYLKQVDTINLLKLLKTYKRCYCCQRHYRNKPTIHDGQFAVFTGVVTERPVALIDCECPCRHYSRFIVKHFCKALL